MENVLLKHAHARMSKRRTSSLLVSETIDSLAAVIWQDKAVCEAALAPPSTNADLKAHLASKLDNLQPRTSAAISCLARALAEQLTLPDFNVSVTEFSSRTAFRQWLPQQHKTFKESKKHWTSPYITSGCGEQRFVGGYSDFALLMKDYDFYFKTFRDKASL